MGPLTRLRATPPTSKVWSRLRLGARKDIRAYWWSSWNGELDAALRTLPESPACPPELYRLLIANPSSALKRIALVVRGSEPIGIASIRQRNGDWVPVTHYLLPGFVFPHRHGHLDAVLAALGVNLAIGWWRMDAPPPAIAGMRDLERIPTFVAPLQEDWERHWSKNLRKAVRRARKKCEAFALHVNAPGAAEWTLRTSEARWRVEGGNEDPALADRIVAARYLEHAGRHFTLTLLDGDRPVAGNTLLQHGSTVVNQCTCRLREYDANDVGNALLDLTLRWSADQGFRALDLGGDYADYKSRWAPESGAKYSFHVCPAAPYYLRRAHDLVAAMRAKGLAGCARAVGRRLSKIATGLGFSLEVLTSIPPNLA
jgi:Acetyltransferase (GNAT) domain